MGPARIQYLVMTSPSGRATIEQIVSTDKPRVISARAAEGCRILSVCDTVAQAAAERSDARGLCCQCDNAEHPDEEMRGRRGKGRHVCMPCQARVLSERLSLSTVALDMIGDAQAIHASVVGTARAEGARGARGERT
jgi:hypothetical protein